MSDAHDYISHDSTLTGHDRGPLLAKKVDLYPVEPDRASRRSSPEVFRRGGTHRSHPSAALAAAAVRRPESVAGIFLPVERVMSALGVTREHVRMMVVRGALREYHLTERLVRYSGDDVQAVLDRRARSKAPPRKDVPKAPRAKPVVKNDPTLVVGHELHLYVVELVGVGVKIGITAKPVNRMAEHARTAGRFGVAIGRRWISEPHVEARANESALKDGNSEWLKAPFGEVRERAKRLPRTRHVAPAPVAR